MKYLLTISGLSLPLLLLASNIPTLDESPTLRTEKTDTWEQEATETEMEKETPAEAETTEEPTMEESPTLRTETPYAAEQRINRSDFGFAIDYPGDWSLSTVEQTEREHVFMLTSPDYEIMLSGTVLAPGVTFSLQEEQAVVSGYKDDERYTLTFHKMETLDLGQNGSSEAAVLRYAFPEGGQLEYLFVVSNGKRLAGFSFMVGEADRDRLMPQVLNILRNFRFSED